MPATISNPEQPTAAADAGTAALFRLTIAHLLLWTAATGFIVAIFPKDWLRSSIPRSDYATIVELVERRQLLEKWSVVAVSPFYGAAVTSVAIAGTRLLSRRSGFPQQPGHWLLVQTGIGVLVASCFVAADPDIIHFSPFALHSARRTFGVVVFVLLAGLAATGIAASQAVVQPWRWRMFFRLHLVSMVVPLLAFLIAISYPTPTGAAFLLRLAIWLWAISSAAAVLIGMCDLLRRSRHDLFHWTGLIAPAAILVHPLLTRWIATTWL
jgi:hypothetical protein